MKVALVHDWLIHMRGGEKVLESMAELYPDAVIYTLFSDRSKLSPLLQKRRIVNSFLHILPGIKNYYRWLLPILPLAIRTLVIPEADLVISSSHCVAKGIRIPKGAKHLCYCHTPMRYLWGFEGVYFDRYPLVLRALIKAVLGGLRHWDRQVNDSIDCFVSNSENVRGRIREFYGRSAEVIYPPLDASFFKPGGVAVGDYYFAVSAFVPYKRLDILIEAFNTLDRRLRVAGKGPLENKYKNLRKSEKISFLGAVDDVTLRGLYAGARAVLFPTLEDFGIVPLEAQACGTPVIAYGRGGALESVKSGVFFEEQTPEAVCRAVLEFESLTLERSQIPLKVKSFERSYFKKHLADCVGRVMSSETLRGP